ncbi:MAG: putative esterase of the alpha-beta hydrolase superfamily [Frankiales bacterium]|nr:putative esterase of the alpha-beta hydrolase superfamily [Frankiales bacterium]
MTTALVLGAGGLTGQAFHLGVLTALCDASGFDGRAADVVVGTSAGSLVAAALTAGFTAEDQAAMLHGEAPSAQARDRLKALQAQSSSLPQLEQEAGAVRRGSLAPGVLLAAARRPWAVRPGAVVSGLIPAGRNTTHGISRGISHLHGQDWPGTRLRVCAVRARDARRVVFGTPSAPKVDVGTAVAASCAIPGYFSPVFIEGQPYVDGGAHSPTNADVVRRDEPSLVVISSPMSFGPGGGTRSPDALIRLAVRRYLAREVRLLRRQGATVVVFQPSAHDLAAMGVNPMKLVRGPDIVETAATTVRSRLKARPELLEQLRQR